MTRFLLEEPPPEDADPMVMLVLAAIKAMNQRQQDELAQRLAQADKEEQQ
jgi:hypothetical protein